MARHLLGGQDVPPESIRFEIEPHGKPVAVDPPQARRPFNVAHTDGLVMCGVGGDTHRRVGIDVERLDRKTSPDLAERYFAKPEVEFLSRLDDERQRREAFLRIWTLKESFIKGLGTGLHTPLADFAFEDIESECPRVRLLNSDLDSHDRWSFFSVQPRPGFIGAVAVATAPDQQPVDIELRNFDDLVAAIG